MKKKAKLHVDLTGVIITHCNRSVMLNETIHGRLTMCTIELLRGNSYQREKVQQFLN
jgi:hypothetical protein